MTTAGGRPIFRDLAVQERRKRSIENEKLSRMAMRLVKNYVMFVDLPL